MAFTGLGSGTELDPYQITTVEQLQEMSDNLTSSFILMNDIDASDTETWNMSGSDFFGFLPIGDTTNPFEGTFDGGGYSINGLYINRTATNTYVGLFGAIRKNISYEKVTNGTFTGDSGWTKGTGWTLPGTYALLSATAGQGTLSQDCSVIAGETYVLIYSISSWSKGTLTPSCGGITLDSQSGNVTLYAQEFTATSTASLVFTPTSSPVDTAAMRVDNVSLIRKLTFKDVALKNADITGYIPSVFVSYLNSPGKAYTLFDNISVNGIVRGNIYIGGFCNYSYGSTFTECSAEVLVYADSIAATARAGAFTSICAGSSFTDCNASGAISITGTLTASASLRFGGFVATIDTGTNLFTDCQSNVSILINVTNTTTGVGLSVGGFVAYDPSANATFLRCSAKGSITSKYNQGQYIGGFASAGTTASKCYATGDIFCRYGSGTVSLGGFGGLSSTASDCYARGDVAKTGIGESTGCSCGGFFGSSSTAVTDCYSTGYVNKDAQYHGGFIGNKSAGVTTTCYWDIESSGESDGKMGIGSSAGIFGKTTAEMILTSTYIGFDFVSTWEEGILVNPAIQGSNITVWPSRTGDYENFEEGVKDDNSFSLDIPTQNEIRWLGALESLLLGTAGDEWQIGTNKLGTALTPTNFSVKQQSEYGSNQVQPVKINSSLLFIDFVSRKLREMTFTDPKYDSPDLTALAEHITLYGITSIARQKNPDSILWFTLGNGSLLSMTYDREQNVIAWAKHPLGGDGYATSVCVIPGATEDAVYISVKRTIDGDILYYEGEALTYEGETLRYGIGNVTYIEKMASRVFTAKEDAFFVDCGITFTSVTPTATITGLGHLNGETVKCLGDGVVLDDAVVEDGKITAKLDGVTTTVSKAQVGLPFTYKLQPMRIVLGDSMGANTRVNKLVVSFLNTWGAKYGINTTDLKTIDFNDVRWTKLTAITGLFTGEVDVVMPGGFDPLNPIIISGDDPLPCTVRAMIPDIDRTG